MGHPDADDWREALGTAGIVVNASIADITQALHALGLEMALV